MGLLSRFRRRSKSQSLGHSHGGVGNVANTDDHLCIDADHPFAAPDFSKKLSRPLLGRIFAFVCPHTVDYSYDASEQSMTEDGCMLCDMRDLAHCALVCKRWYFEARSLLYAHVRIDAVHYCQLEVELAAKRKRRSVFDRNGEAIDAPQVRLRLFMQAVRDSRDLGAMVLSLRMPYMTREASKAEIARTISVTPNLRYVDLPAGIYSDDASCLALKQELIGRCPDLRRMSYRYGAEASFAQLPDTHLWGNLEVLEVSRLQIEPRVLRLGLASFSSLRDLTLDDLPWLDDSAFLYSESLPPIPPLQRLTLRDTPNVTASGLAGFFSLPANRKALQSLTLSSTGVLPATLSPILAAAPQLRALLVIQEVTRSFPADRIPPLASRSLQLLHFEISSPAGSSNLPPVAASHYTYLISSLMSNSLPALRDLYVRDASFPETLLLAPPPRLFGGDSGNGPPFFSRGISQPLNVYSKGLDELEWNFTPYEPPSTRGNSRRDSTTRPVSFHDAQLSRSWGGEARKSVLVGNGFGGFLAVPVDDGRPKSSGGLRRDSRQDLWR
ncbi:F-box domain protein [Aspergillus heteromorphus CBS 117.55]|uniref:F-box domain protein n=1 Tax=Aspergillus heteromorphus CBS 117.55 TaxID=1448321 RepID=A0A317WK46_9EURO|nr:F-box domain protein [Aspergillus heteromorphus CBS 117.55]PWY86834.1 F-box domain protein [Aspergillus heteromorphus CBS 117.55]